MLPSNPFSPHNFTLMLVAIGVLPIRHRSHLSLHQPPSSRGSHLDTLLPVLWLDLLTKANREIFRIINSTTPLEIEPLKFCVNLNSKSSSKSSNPYASLTKVDGTHLTTSLAVQLSQRGPSRGDSGWSAAPLHSASLVLRQTRLRKRDVSKRQVSFSGFTSN